MARNKADYERLIGLSDPTVTAEERLMQEMARRQMEQDLRSQRGAIMNDRQARGVSGSGDELTAMLMGQNELANRRAMEEMQVQANAQNRAMEALFGAADLGMQIRGAEAEESQFRGSAADQAARWNKELKQNYDKWRTETLDQVNKSKVDRGKTLYDARTGDNKNKIDAALGAGQLELSGRAGKTGQYSGDSDDVFEGNKREVDMEILKRSGGLKF